MSAALGALVLGPEAIWARKGATQRPRLHRAFGYAWVTLMVLAAVSALFIRDFGLPNLAGYTPIHLLTVITAVGLFGGIRAIRRGEVDMAFCGGHDAMIHPLGVLSFIALSEGQTPLERLETLAEAGDFAPRARIGKYELLHPLGTGGMAQVMVARTVNPAGVSRLVALKRILPSLMVNQ